MQSRSQSFETWTTTGKKWRSQNLSLRRGFTNSTGSVRARYDYNPYGARTKLTGDLDVDFGYTGHYDHRQTGMVLTRNRAYYPMLGRWLSRDPIKDAEMSQGPNLYEYVGNNPVSQVDPLGLTGYVFFDGGGGP